MRSQEALIPKLPHPKHLVDLFTCRVKNKGKGQGQHESPFATEPEAQKRDDTTGPEAQKRDDMKFDANGGDVQMDDNKDDLLDDYDIYGDLQ